MNILLFLIAALELSCAIPYVLDTYRGKTRPELATWSAWGAAALLAAISSYSEGLIVGAVFSAALFVEIAIILIVAAEYGKFSHTKYDLACIMGVVLGLFIWGYTKNPFYGILFSIISDFIAAIPTYVHGWRRPNQETIATFTIAILVNVLMLAAIQEYNVETLMQPIYFLVMNSTLSIIILYRRDREIIEQL